jgi:gamma-glutamylcyclotransferase (GGCT)/AIG2-like uncharacterized protein YtfP
MNGEFIFVYGTLRKVSGTPMSRVLADYSEYIDEASIQAVLYQVDDYPCVIESTNPNDKVSGELYKILDGDTLLPLLDEYEECTEQYPEPHEYIRKQLTITLPDRNQVNAWVYVYNRDVTQLQQIKHYG